MGLGLYADEKTDTAWSMKFVITRNADLDPRGIACRQCGKLLSTFDESADTHTPAVEELSATGAVPVPNFGWFCGQECADIYSQDTGVSFRRDAEGKIRYY